MSSPTIVVEKGEARLTTHEIEEDIVTLLKTCVQEIEPELDHRPEIKIYGKICHQQRSVGFYSDTSKGYNYSTSITPSKKMKPCLRELLTYVNDKFDATFNGILINKYENGLEYISKHSDDIRNLDPRCGVVLMSVGAVRKFRIRDKSNNQVVVDLPTHNNKIIVMNDEFQTHFTHEIPVEKKINTPRYSFTFRYHIN